MRCSETERLPEIPDKYSLSGAELEQEALRLLNDLEASAKFGPRGRHDIEVSFPNAFIRPLYGSSIALRSTKEFVVEVKGKTRGVDLDDLKQIQKWVSDRIGDEAEIKRDLLKIAELMPQSKDLENSEVSHLREAIEVAVGNVKGVLIVNGYRHLTVDERSKKPDWFAANLREDAYRSRIAVLSWVELLGWHKQIKAGNIDALNFWCSLFETSGHFAFKDYDWRKGAEVFFDLFQEEPCYKLYRGTGPRFLQD